MSSVVMKADNLNFSESAVDDVRKNVMNIWWNIYVFYSAYCGSVELTMPQVIKNPLDQWLLSKVEGLTKVVTTAMDSYDVVGATRPLMAFAKDFSTWYVRLSRERLRNDKNSQAVFAYALSKYTHLMAPFAPFMAERIYQNMPHTKDSIHLEDWPTVEAKYQNPKLESDMMAVMDIVEGAHALRKNANLRLRQPLSRLTVASKLGGDLLKVIADELNVKEVVVGSELSLDTNLTPELEDEGKARDLMRDIQGERKKQGLKPTDQVVVITPSYPTSWESEIKAKVGAKSLSQGEVFSVTKA
ncbi:hypothetical protein DYH11_04400 [Candidatus Microgenomates bacterium CPR3]|nr:hypothetical protein [Candidatus Microgenomates bacterium CPR3]